ncbi:MAG TPA: hypothetical protein VLK22_01190 [Candidatus Udaeobacter sp.]|nr:hypothetical protein [Candidatus Udaeobacter sp.]
MNKKYLYFLPSLIITFIGACFLIASFAAAKEGYNWKFNFIVFILSILLNWIYWFRLAVLKVLDIKIIGKYIIFSIILFFVFIFLFIAPPYKREIRFDLGEDPFVPGATITAGRTVYLWEKDFYAFGKNYENLSQKIQIKMQTDRRGSLIGHVGNDLRGWSVEKVRNAFGEPARIVRINKDLEKWIYNPWTDHLDWEMPVYIQNNILYKIGD